MGLMMAKTDDVRVKPPLKARLKAWWDGVELEEPVEEAPETVAEDPDPFPFMAEIPPLEEPLVKLLMAVWGEGNSKPGDKEFYQYLVEPFNLNGSMTLLDFGCGLGGGGRVISKAYEMSVSGVDTDSLMVAAGKALSNQVMADKKAEISKHDPKSPALKANHFDCAICVDRMHTIINKSDTLKALATTLKSRGQLVITDIILGEGVTVDDPRLANILGEGATRSQFWSLAAYQKTLVEQKFEVKAEEDIGERYRKLVTEAWSNFSRNPAAIEASKASPQLTVKEAEYWQRLMLALDAGLLKIHRFNLVKVG